ncbi:MAG: hypothetical protein B6245_21045, partial [Desulfobacteraceae bacterium 4572_88]
MLQNRLDKAWLKQDFLEQRVFIDRNCRRLLSWPDFQGRKQFQKNIEIWASFIYKFTLSWKKCKLLFSFYEGCQNNFERPMK